MGSIRRPLRIAVVVSVAVGVVASSVSPAWAGDPAKAKELVNQARAAAKAERFAEALSLLKKAQENLDHPAIWFAQARMYEKLVQLDRAERALDKVEEFQLTAKMKAAASKERAAIQGKKETLGGLRVTVEPDDAEVLVDGERHKHGFDRWITPGKRRVEAFAEGYNAAVRPVEIEAGRMLEFKILLRELTGRIRVIVPGGLKGVDVKLDGKTVPISDGQRAGDVATVDATPGAHEVVCIRGGRRDAPMVKVLVNQTVEARCKALATGFAAMRGAVGWGGVATGVLLAALGGYHVQGYFSDVARTEPGGDHVGYIASSDRAVGGTAFLVGGAAISVASYLLLLRKGEGGGGATSSWLTLPGGPSASSGLVHGTRFDAGFSNRAR